MTRLIDRLDGWRYGRAGATLFYLYLIAILCVAMLAACSYRQVKHQNTKLNGAVAALNVQSMISCEAIHGALEYWYQEREIVRDALADPMLLPDARDRQLRREKALTGVLVEGAKLDCKGGVKDAR